VTAFIGPSGCGKTTLLRCLNRTNDIIEHTHTEARISQRAAFFHLGDLVEASDTEQIFLMPKTQRCLDFVTGRYG